MKKHAKKRKIKNVDVRPLYYCYIRKYFKTLAPCANNYTSEETQPDEVIEVSDEEELVEDTQEKEMTIYDLFCTDITPSMPTETLQNLKLDDSETNSAESEGERVRCDSTLQYFIVVLYQNYLVQHRRHNTKLYHLLRNNAFLELNPDDVALQTEVYLCKECHDQYNFHLAHSGEHDLEKSIPVRPILYNESKRLRYFSVFVFKYDTLAKLFWYTYQRNQLETASVILLHMIFLLDRILRAFQLDFSSDDVSNKYSHLLQDRFSKAEQLLMGVIALYRKSKIRDLMMFFKDRYLHQMFQIYNRTVSIPTMLEFVFFCLEIGQTVTALDTMSNYHSYNPTSVTVTGYLGILHCLRVEEKITAEDIKPEKIASLSNYSLAVRFLEYSVQRTPDNASFIHHLGKMYILGGQVDKCEKLFADFALSLSGTLPQANVQYLKFLLSMGEMQSYFQKEVKDLHDQIITTCETILATDQLNQFALNILKEYGKNEEQILSLAKYLWNAIECCAVREGNEFYWTMLAEVLHELICTSSATLLNALNKLCIEAEEFIDLMALDKIVFSPKTNYSKQDSDKIFTLVVLTKDITRMELIRDVCSVHADLNMKKIDKFLNTF